MATNRFTRGTTAQIAAAIAAGTLLEGTPIYDETLGVISIARSATPNTPATYLDSMPSAVSVQRARSATQTVITPEEFGAPNDFDPAYAYSLGVGSANWTAYMASKNASLAHAKMLQYIKANLKSTRVQASGRYYLGPLDGTTQRLYGRQIYGTNTALTTLGSPAQAVYERMPVVAEGLSNVEWLGLGCAYYQAERTGSSTSEADTLLAFYQCTGIHFTGIGSMFGYAPATATADTENAALLRFGIGTRDFSVDDGWHLGAFLGDGINIGGTRYSGGSDDPAHAAYVGRITASIRERYGNGHRPWEGADGSLTPAAGANLGTKSRLAISVIHASDLKIASREIYGAIDVEPNTAAQLATDIYWDGELRAMGIVPLPAGAHPWQEEALTIPGAAGSVELEAYIAYNSPQAAMAVRGGINGKIEKGYVYLQGGMAVPIKRAEFVVAGHVAVGSLSGSVGTLLDGIPIQNVTAPTVFQRLLYGQTTTPTTVGSLIYLSSVVRNLKVTGCELADANFSVIGLNPIPNHTGGNSEQNGSYLNNRNTGRVGAGAVLGFVKHATSVTAGNISAANPTVDPLTSLAYTPVAVTLTAAGKIDYAANPGMYYIVTPNSGTSQTFTGVVDPAVMPNNARIIIRAAAGNSLNINSNAGVASKSNVTVALTGMGEVEFYKPTGGGQLFEARRQIIATQTLPPNVSSAALTASAAYDPAQMQAVMDRLNLVASLSNNLRTAVTQSGNGNN